MKSIKLLTIAVALLTGCPLLRAAPTPTVLLRDTFDANTANTSDLNVDLARQSGTKAPISYSLAGGPTLYGHQLQNVNAQNQLLVADFPNSTSSLNFNFNGANSAGGLKISFDLDSVPTVYGGTPDNWGCINLGASQTDQLVNVNGGQTHFGILFRAAGTLQAFDGGAVVNPTPEPVYTTRPAGTTNHIDLVFSDADGNPFDGLGSTVIEVFVNGGALPVWTFTKGGGGYANNYINLQGSFRAHFDNLTIAQLVSAPELVNPSFEADTFTVFPGYVSGNGPITGWSALPGHGVNPGTFGGPFTDNGTIPDGTKAAFLQEDGAMRQVINGLSIGANYQIRYFENSRNCCNGTAPFVEVKIGATTIVSAHAVPPVGGAAPYREVLSDVFAATSSAMELSIIKSNPQGGDTTLLIDNVSIVAPGTAPIITGQPRDAVVALGDTVILSVAASGSAPLSYQWYFGNDPIFGATSPTLSVLVDFPDAAGNYHVTISNPSGTVTSRTATISVRDVLAGLFNTGVDDSGVALADGAIDSHYKIVVNPDSASPDATVEDSTVFPIAGGPWVANNPGSKWIGPRFDTAAAAGAVGTGGDYVYRTILDLGGYDPATVVVTGVWATDNEGSDIFINGQSTGQKNTTQFTGLTPFTINSGLVAGLNSIEFKLNNSAVGYTGLRVDQIRVLGTPLPAGTRPFIITQPQGATLSVGQTANFSVQANGSAPLSYQWYYGPDAIPNATGPTLSVFIEFADAAGNYSVEITNPFGSIRSSAATLVVLAEPVILTQPQSQVAVAGDSVTFNVSAIGEAPLTYQWIHNNQDIPGANDTNFVIASVAAADAGNYAVRISNLAGITTSVTATLTLAEVVPGLFNTGVDASGSALPDNTVDPHYTLVVNPDSTSPTTIVEDSTVFPIVAGPWVANESDSKWIGPRFETSAAAGGDYVYRQTFSLVGINPATVRITGEWSTDNAGIDISINGTSTGLVNSGQFVTYTAFAITSGFQAGENTLEFRVNNADVGYTGLRVRKLRLTGIHSSANQAPSFVKGPDVTVAENSGPRSISNWATAISAGAGESGQALTFLDQSDNPGLFSAGPAIDPTGTLTFTPAPATSGQATVTVRLRDDGGTADGGVDTSAAQTFIIRVTPVNDAPHASFVVSPLFTTEGLEHLTVIAANNSNACVILDGSLSSDPEGDAITFAWLVDGSLNPIATGAIASVCLELGLHDITLVVTDSGGADGTTTQQVEVITAAEAVDLLITAVNDADLDRKNKRPFLATLKAVQASFDRGQTNAAVNQLGAFQNKVQAQLAPSQPNLAAEWIALAEAIINAVQPQ
jgi:hypothetical protein